MGDGLVSHSGEVNDTRLLNTSEIIDKHQPYAPYFLEKELI